MASITWTCVFALLVIELIVTFILAVPIPRRIRNVIARKLIFRFHLGDNFAKAIWFIAIALVLALAESYNSTMQYMEKLNSMDDQDVTTGIHGHGHGHHHQKERLYRAERNMYLAGFALTLLFVIGRILQLMQESVELEDELEYVRKPNSSTTASATTGTEGVEMTKVEKKNPGDKKKD